MIAVSTVRDRAAAEVAKEALTALDIPVEVRALAGIAYLGSATPEEYEIRVPEEHEEKAFDELDRLAAEMDQAVFAAAGVPPDEAEDDLHADEERPKKLSWALVISLLLPFPGGGCMYARANALGLLIFGVSLGLLGAGVAGVHFSHAGEVWIGAKLVDLTLAPFAVWRFNRKLAEGKHAART